MARNALLYTEWGCGFMTSYVFGFSVLIINFIAILQNVTLKLNFVLHSSFINFKFL